MKTVNIRRGRVVTTQPVVFESALPDADGCKFYVATSDDFIRQVDSETSSGLLIAFGPEKLKDDESSCYSDYFAFSAEDDKKHIAAQLRELADWFDKQ